MPLCPPLERGQIVLIDINPEKAAVNVKDIKLENLPSPRLEPPIICVHKEITDVTFLITGCANFC